MAITPTEISLSEARFVFDGAGNVSDVLLEASYVLQDSNGIRLGRQSVLKSIWSLLTPTQQAQADTVGKRFRDLASSIVPT